MHHNRTYKLWDDIENNVKNYKCKKNGQIHYFNQAECLIPSQNHNSFLIGLISIEKEIFEKNFRQAYFDQYGM